MIFQHCKLIQEEGCVLFYRFDRHLNGYMIAGLLTAPDMVGKLALAKVWKYFVSEIVRNDDIYCSIPDYTSNEMFTNYTTYHSELNGIKIYKVDNYLKESYSSYTKHLESKSNG